MDYHRQKDQKMVHRRLKPVAIMFSEFYFYMAAFIEDEEVKKDFDVINDSYPTIYRIDRIKKLTVLEEDVDGFREFNAAGIGNIPVVDKRARSSQKFFAATLHEDEKAGLLNILIGETFSFQSFHAIVLTHDDICRITACSLGWKTIAQLLHLHIYDTMIL